MTTTAKPTTIAGVVALGLFAIPVALAVPPTGGLNRQLTSAAQAEIEPAIAYDPTRQQWMIVYNRASKIWYTLYDATGTTIVAGPTQVSQGAGTNARQPAVVYNATDDEFGLVWAANTSNYRIHGLTVAGGSPWTASGIATVSTSGAGARDMRHPRIDWDSTNDRYGIVWCDDGNNDVYGQILDNNLGTLAGNDPDGQPNANDRQVDANLDPGGTCDIVFDSVDDKHAIFFGDPAGGKVFLAKSTFSAARDLTDDGTYNPGGATVDVQDPRAAFDPTNDEVLVVFNRSDLGAIRALRLDVTSGGNVALISAAEFNVLTGSPTLPAVCYEGDDAVFLVVGLKSGAVKGQWVNAGAETMNGSEFPITDANAAGVDAPAVAGVSLGGTNGAGVVWKDSRAGNDNAHGNFLLPGIRLTAGTDVTPATVKEGDTGVPFLRVTVETGGQPTITQIQVYLTTTGASLAADLDLASAYVSTDAVFDPGSDNLFDTESTFPGATTGTITLTGSWQGGVGATYYVFLVLDIDANAGGSTFTVQQSGSAGEADDAYTLASGDRETSPATTHYSVSQAIANVTGTEFELQSLDYDGVDSTPLQGGTNIHFLSVQVRGRNTPQLSTVVLDFSTSDNEADLDTVKVYRSADDVFDGADVFFGSATVGSLGDITVSKDAGYTQGNGIYYLIVLLDVNAAAGTGRRIQIRQDGLDHWTFSDATSPTDPNSILTIQSALLAIPAILRVPSVYASIQAAVNAIPGVPGAPYVVELENAGTFAEVVTIQNKTGTATNTITIRPVTGIWSVVTGNTNGTPTFKLVNSDHVILERLDLANNTKGQAITIDSNCDFVTVRNVVCRDNKGEEIKVDAADSVTILNSVLFDDDGKELLYVTSSPGTTGVSARNTIFRLAGGAGAYHWRVQAVADVATANYNCYYNSGTNATPFRIGGSSTNFLDWKGNTGDDASSIETDPKFVDEAGRDFHVKSETGSYPNAGGGTFDADATSDHSPCVDAGDPADAYGAEPDDNGGRVNVGAYGNTTQASRSKGHLQDHWTGAAGTSSWDDHANWCHGRPDATGGSTYNDEIVVRNVGTPPIFAPSAATVTAGALTIETGASLTLNTAGKVLDVNGPVAVSGTLQFTAAATIRVSGNWDDSSGTYAGLSNGTGTVEFDGAAAQDVRSTSSNSFWNLTANGAGVRSDTSVVTTIRVGNAFAVQGGKVFRLSSGDTLVLLRDKASFPPDQHSIAGTFALVLGDGTNVTTVKLGNHQQLHVTGAFDTEVGAVSPSFPGNAYALMTRADPGDGWSMHVAGTTFLEFVKFEYLYGRSGNSDEFTQAGIQSALAFSGGGASITRFRVCWFSDVLDGGAPPSDRYPRAVYLLGDLDGDLVTDNSFDGAGNLVVLHKLRFDGTLAGLRNVEKRAPGNRITIKNGAGERIGDAYDMDGLLDDNVTTDPDTRNTGKDDIEFGSSPTAVELVELSATGYDGAVAVDWRTAAEIDNLGFHVYRSAFPDRDWIQVTGALVLGLGDSALGGTYRFVDRTVENGLRYYYRLEDVDVRGVRTFHGPVEAIPGGEAGEVPEAPAGLTNSGEALEGPGTVATPSPFDPPAETGGGRPSWTETLLGIDLASAGIRLISWSEAGALIEILPPEPSVEPIVEDGAVVNRISLAGYARASEPGRPEVLEKRILLATPGIESATHQILALEGRTLERVLVARAASAPARPAPEALPDPIGAGPRRELTGEDFLREARVELQRRILNARRDLDRRRREARDRLSGRPAREVVDRSSPSGEDAAPSSSAAALGSREPDVAPGWQPALPIERGGLVQVGGRQFLPLRILPVRTRGTEAWIDRRILVRIDFHGRAASPEPGPGGDALVTPEQLRLAADRRALKIEVSADGLYALGQGELAAAGFDVGADPRSFRMHHLGREIAIRVDGELDRRFGEGDRILFYGSRNPWRTEDDPEATRYTDRNVYWLSVGPGSGLRMETLWVDAHVVPGIASGPAVRHHEVNALYYPRLTEGEGKDHWYDSRRLFNTPGGNHPLSRTTVAIAADGLSNEPHTASLTLGLAGVTDLAPGDDHHVVVSIGGHVVGETTWDGRSSHVARIEFPSPALSSDGATIELRAPADRPGVAYDSILLNFLRLEYRRDFSARSGVSEMVVEARGLLRAPGFGAGPVEVLELGDPARPRSVRGFSARGGTLSMRVDPGRYLAVEDSAVRSVRAIRPNRPSSWHDGSQGADWIAVAHASLLEGVAPLADHRTAEGLRTAVADVEDVYDEFTAGIPDPSALRAFVARARAAWAVPPRYLLLAGDATHDPHQYLGGAADLVPAALVQTETVWTASDTWFAAVEGDDLFPDLAVGRIPAGDPAELAAAIDKILTRETEDAGGSWRRRVSLVADDPDATGDFVAASETLAGLYPEGWDLERLYLPDHGTSALRARIAAAFAQGRWLVNYQGHGSMTFWAQENVFSDATIDSLGSTGRFPIVTVMDCMNGLFQSPIADCLGEKALLVPGRGAAAFWGSTGLVEPGPQEWINEEFTRIAVRDRTATRIGDAIGMAYVRGWAGPRSDDVVRSWVLLGDPAMRME